MDGVLHRATRWLLGPEDAAGPVAFRFMLGMLLAYDAFRYIVAGWPDSMFLQPAMLFKYWGFEWVEPLPRVLHHAVFYVSTGAALGIALGYRYRLCATLFFLGHAYIYLLSAAHYLNHAYLIVLLTLLIIPMPMDRALSLRTRKRPESAWYCLPRWPRAALMLQIGVVYFYGGIAKINTDWLVYHMPVRRWLANSARKAPFGAELIQSEWFTSLVAYGGCIYDLLIFPALLWRKTRVVAIVLSAGFHLTNAFLFEIGVFPWLMLAMTTLFLEPSWPRRLPFLGPRIATAIDRGRSLPSPSPGHRRAVLVGLGCWFLIQILMPLRHHLYPGDVAWTEEGHHYAWRMKLRSKRGKVRCRAEDKNSDRHWIIHPRHDLTARQYRKLKGQPDLIVQYAHFVAEKYRRDGFDVEVYCDVWSSLNYRPRQRLIDPTVDLSQERMRLGPQPWILPFRSVPPPTK